MFQISIAFYCLCESWYVGLLNEFYYGGILKLQNSNLTFHLGFWIKRLTWQKSIYWNGCFHGCMEIRVLHCLNITFRYLSISSLWFDSTSSPNQIFISAWFKYEITFHFHLICPSSDGTPARSFRTNSSNHAIQPEPRKLPTLGAILKAEPLRPPPPPQETQPTPPSPATTMRLADLLRERQESFTCYDGPACAISRTGSSCGAGNGEQWSHCCIPSFVPRTSVSYAKGRRKCRWRSDRSRECAKKSSGFWDDNCSECAVSQRESTCLCIVTTTTVQRR